MTEAEFFQLQIEQYPNLIRAYGYQDASLTDQLNLIANYRGMMDSDDDTSEGELVALGLTSALDHGHQ